MICNRKRNVTPRGVEVTDAQFRAGPLPAEARQIWQWLVQSGRVFSEGEQGKKMDDDLSRELREALGAGWCADWEEPSAHTGCISRMPTCRCEHWCTVSIKPSARVAYALAEKAQPDGIHADANVGGGWTAVAYKITGDDTIQVDAVALARAEAECRALLSLLRRPIDPPDGP